MNQVGRLTQEVHTSSLDGTWVPRWTFRIRLVPIFLNDLPVLLKICIKNHANHAQFLRTFHLEPTKDAAILGNGNLAFKTNVGTKQILEIGIRAEIGVHKRRRDIAVGRVTVKGGDAIGKTASVVLV